MNIRNMLQTVNDLKDSQMRKDLYNLMAATHIDGKTIPTMEDIDIMLTDIIEAAIVLKSLVLTKIAVEETGITKEDFKEEKKPVKSESRKLVSISYDEKKNEIHLGVQQSEINKDYLKYLLEHLQLPADAKVIYKK